MYIYILYIFIFTFAVPKHPIPFSAIILYFLRYRFIYNVQNIVCNIR